VSFTAEGRALLFSVEVHHLLSQYSSHRGQTLGFQWYLRLREGHIGTSDSAAGNAGSTGEGREKRREESRRRDVSRAEAVTQGPGSLSYEIRAVSVGPRGGCGGDVLCSAGPVLPPCTGYISPHAWVRCSGVAPNSVIPLKGRIEVWVLSRGGGGVRSVEANQLRVTNITHTVTPSRGPSKDISFRYYLPSNSDVADLSVSERFPETSAAAVPKGGEEVEVHQIGGDHSGWTNNLNQACSLLTFSESESVLSCTSASLATQIPKGFSTVRRIVCSDVGEFSGRKHSLYFHVKLSFYGTSRYCRGGDERGEKETSGKISEVRGSQGYEWRVLVARGRGCSAEGRAEMVTEGSCPYKQPDEITHPGPWVWSGICTELGPLHSGDEVLLVTRVLLSSPGGAKDRDMASSCSVEVSNCEIVSTLAGQNEGSRSGGEFGEGRWEGDRDRVKMGSTFSGGATVSGTIPRIPHTAHFALFNDQSLALPIC
jgi:hypothetical protein